MRNLWLIMIMLCCMHRSLALEMQHTFENHAEMKSESDMRGRRDVIEEEKFYNIRSDTRKDNNNHVPPWLPAPLPPDEESTTRLPEPNERNQVLTHYQTTEKVTDKPTGRGARASNENWIKLPFPSRDEPEGDILTPPQPSGELINSRMPRINFVTQNKALETSESRNDKESIQRSTRTEDIRTQFVRPGEDERAKTFKPVYPRQALYYPEESRRFYDDRYNPNDVYRRDPMYDLYDRRRYYPGGRVDRYDEGYDNPVIPRKPKRIIYYAHLPEVVRTPPSVDLRYRYSADPYRRYDDESYGRTGRYDYRFKNRYPHPPYPYAPLRKEERNYRDLAIAGTTTKDKKEDKVTPTPVLPPKEDSYKKITPNIHGNLINSHQYHEGVSIHYEEPTYNRPLQDILRSDEGYLRYDEPLFQGAIDHYQNRYY